MPGNKALLSWLQSFSTLVRVSVEGIGSYGAGLARYLRGADIDVVEVHRPNCQERRLGQAKTRDGLVEAFRALVVARRSARSSRIQTINQIRHLGFTAPEEIRRSLHGVSRRLLPT